MNHNEVLEQAQRRLEELQRLAHLGSWEFDVRDNHVTWTDGLYRIYGVTPDTFPATYEAYLNMVHPGDRARVTHTINAALQQGGSFEFEERIVRPDGSTRTLISIGRTIRDATGTPTHLVGVCRDITEETIARAQLARRERDLALAQELAHLGSWSYDIERDAIEWSDEMFRIYGIEKSMPLTYDRYLTHIHPDDVDAVIANVRRAMQDGQPFEHEHRIVRGDGAIRVVVGHGDVETDDNGRIIRMLGTAQDITARKRAEEQERAFLQEQTARLQAETNAKRLRFISDASAILASSLDYEETLQNVARLAVPAIADWCAVDILTQEGSVKRLAVEHFDAAKVQFALEIAERYPSDPNSRTGVPHVLRTGETVWMAEIPEAMITAAAIDDEHLRLIRQIGLRSYAVVPLKVQEHTIGALTFVHAESMRTFDENEISLLRDVAHRAAIAIHNARLVRELSDAHARLQTQSEELEAQALELEEAIAATEMRNEELEEKTVAAIHARRDAEDANKSKSEFLANMSHELRTPLNAIGGYAQLLELGVHGPMTDTQLQAVSRIKTNQGRLLALINDLLNFVKLRAGRLELTLSPEPLCEILLGLEPLIAPQVQQKALILTIRECPNDLFVHTNRERAEQVLLNLISNAIKFTPEGGSIAIEAEPLPTSVKIHVTDTGMGIPEDRQSQIFDPFVQLGTAPRRDNQGVGLGLAISRDLMHGMGGDLTVESQPGAGARFTMTLARATPAAVVVETIIN